MKKAILVIEDDHSVFSLIRDNLNDLPFHIEHSENGRVGLDSALKQDYALVILDIGLPGIGGFDICKKLRKEKRDLPIIMLTSRTEEIDRILGLEFGADDYVGKPFSPRELNARVRAILRRFETVERKKKEPRADQGTKSFGNLVIDFEARVVKLDQVEIALTSTEFDILALLSSNPGRPFSRAELAEHILGVANSGYEASINSHLARLRGKLEPDSEKPIYLETLRGIGYRFSTKFSSNNSNKDLAD